MALRCVASVVTLIYAGEWVGLTTISLLCQVIVLAFLSLPFSCILHSSELCISAMCNVMNNENVAPAALLSGVEDTLHVADWDAASSAEVIGVRIDRGVPNFVGCKIQVASCRYSGRSAVSYDVLGWRKFVHFRSSEVTLGYRH